VFFIDPRYNSKLGLENYPNGNVNSIYRVSDNSHPSALGGIELSILIAKTIYENN